MKPLRGWATALCVLTLAASVSSFPQAAKQDWSHFVRIGAFSLKSDNADEIVSDAERNLVFGIEVDNDIPGRYETFLDPAEKLKAIRTVAEKAHKAGNYTFVYIAGTECITAHVDAAPHSLAKDHPDWLQRNLTGEPAIFGEGSAFWIKKGDEDVWISPYATEWRTLYMKRVREIAATGVDGIYVDIPYWMTHFDGWENSWASFDDYTVAAFRKSTGLDARHDLKLGDFADANFRRWIDFRTQTMTDFMAEIATTAKGVNPKIKVIPEIYPGIEQESVRVGADVYQMYAVVDSIAHEYEFGEGDHMATSRTPLDWFKYQVGMQSFRAFAEGKPTWILNYSWDGDKKLAPPEPMKNLAMSQVMAGANFWDARGHVMSGSNDMPTRREIFAWIKDHEKTLYSPRRVMHPVGIYFSPSTRNYYADEFLRSYQGILLLLIQSHLEYQIVTPRTLANFQGETLVLPDVRVLDEPERQFLKRFVGAGKRLIVTGQDASGLTGEQVVRFAECPGKTFLQSLERDFAKGSAATDEKFMGSLRTHTHLQVQASPWVATQIAEVNGNPHVFFANFNGLRPHENAIQTPEHAAQIVYSGKGQLHFLPFLGKEQSKEGTWKDGKTTFVLPDIEKGAVAWVDRKD